MQTRFSPEQLTQPAAAEAERILRACVHCGFCTATCPTYVLLGDERDSPRGRIYMIKDMLEAGRPATPQVVQHIDRCLSCLACTTTCPSGVDYMHLIDAARHHVEDTYQRPLHQRLLRSLLAWLLPHPGRFRLALRLGQLGRLVPRALIPPPLRPMLALVPAQIPPRPAPDTTQATPATIRRRVALLPGCAQQVLGPHVNAAVTRLLARHGCSVTVLPGTGCCGALRHHLGKGGEPEARANVLAWRDAVRSGAIDTIVITASGCGTTVKDYGHLLRHDPDLAEDAARIASITRDVTEVLDELGLVAPVIPTGQRVTYHSACSLQHGQQVREAPKALLRAAGFQVNDVPEGHLCCGSAGTYNLLQPELAGQLRTRKLANIATTAPEIIAAGNIGCITQLASGAGAPVVHTAELLDWATGGPKPAALR